MYPSSNKVIGRYGRSRVERKGFRINFRVLWRIFLLSLPAFMSGVILYFVFISSYFEIKNINISGLKTVAEEGVMAEVNKIFSERKLVIGKLSNYFLFSSDLARAEIQGAFPKIGEIDVAKVYPEVLNINVREREAIGVWCSLAQKCFYFDKKGVIFEKAPRSFGALMLMVEDQREVEANLGSMILSEEQLDTFREGKIFVNKNFPFSIKTFLIIPKDEIEILTSENWRILLGRKESREYQFSNLKYLLDDQIQTRRGELEYVDLRLGNRIYYKFKSLDVIHED